MRPNDLPALEAVNLLAGELGLDNLSLDVLAHLVDDFPEAMPADRWLGTVFEASEVTRRRSC
jgi:hypothetical protein